MSDEIIYGVWFQPGYGERELYGLYAKREDAEKHAAEKLGLVVDEHRVLEEFGGTAGPGWAKSMGPEGDEI